MKIKLIAILAMAATAASYGALVIDYDFNGITAGTTVQANLSVYDFTSSQPYVASNAVANTLAFTGGSSGTDYIVRDKGTGHENALYFKTINPQGSDVAMYLQNIDMTAGGANDSQVVRVSWSFDILGYDTIAGSTSIVPDAWTVKVRSDSNGPLNNSDNYYATATTAQTFSFLEDTTSETATDGTWTTISGSYDVAVGTGGTWGGLQIRQPLGVGAYTSAGGIFLDNIQVDVTAIPEPATIGMLGLGGLMTLMIRRMKRV